MIALIVIAGCLAAGYYFGRAFYGRSIENMKIVEAARVEDKLFRSEKTAKLFAALADHQAKIEEIVATLARQDVDPLFQLRKLHEFMKHCALFVESYQPPSLRELFPSSVFGPEIMAGAADLVDRINRLFTMTQVMLQEREILAAVGTGEPDAKPEPMLANLIYESDPRGEGEVKVPWNKGQFILIPPDSQVTFTPVPAEAPPETMPIFRLKVKVGAEAALVEVDTDHIVEIDAWPMIRRREEAYRMSLLARVQTVLVELQTIAGELRWEKYQEELQEQAAKEPYFTL